LLSTNKNTMFALGQFAQDVFGTSTVFNGLACVPNTPAAMNVIVQPGVVYAQAALDATAYSSLAADSTVTQKQGILKTAQTFATPAPVTSGQSIVYLISGAFLEADTSATVLPYYNASNPAQAYSGPNNLGTSQNTLRQDTVQLTLTTGVPATTGNQLTPATPSGQIALYTVTVAYGATSVTAANITKLASAPFLTGPISTGRLLRTTVFTVIGGSQQVSVNGGAFTTVGASSFAAIPATNLVDVETVGGGGGGGGTLATTASQIAAGSGGQSGAYVRVVLGSGFGGGVAITAGAAGTSGAGSSGSNGGSSSFGSLITAPGGSGGNAGLAFANTISIYNPTTGMSVASVSSGIAVSRGMTSATGGIYQSANTNVQGGSGGSNPLGTGFSGNTNFSGATAVGYGAGGSGASFYGSASAALAGGAGAPGAIIVREYQ
jgi:hypothetical protein